MELIISLCQVRERFLREIGQDARQQENIRRITTLLMLRSDSSLMVNFMDTGLTFLIVDEGTVKPCEPSCRLLPQDLRQDLRRE